MPPTESIVLTGHLEPGAPDLVYVPFEVPAGVCRVAVRYSYDRPPVPDGMPGNACDIGVFDARGTGPDGFRGWSGGARDRFEVGTGDATPGYLPGPLPPGTWHVALGPYTVAPGGMDYRVEVLLTAGPAGPTPAPAYPPMAVVGRGPGWYRGDCHLHTVYSDGSRTPAEVAAEARAAGLDFIATTEHNTPAGHRAWGPHAGDDLLVILGEEVTTRNGHWLALGLRGGEFVDWRYRVRDGVVERHRRGVRDAGGLCVAAHPYGECVACGNTFDLAGFDAVEVWNGPWSAGNETALAEWDRTLAAAGAAWRPAVGNSDAHEPGQAVGVPHTVVRAGALARDALVAGIAAGHCWITDSAAVGVEFAATTGDRVAGIGERLDAAAHEPVTVTLAVTGVPDAAVVLATDQGRVLRHAGDTVTWRTTPRASTYVRAEVRHPDGTMAALTNPIPLGRIHHPHPHHHHQHRHP